MNSFYQAPSSDAPGLPPPPGHTSRFKDAYTLGPLYTLTMAQCLILATCLVAARFYTKARIVKKLTWEDLTCLIGYLAYVAYLAVYQSLTLHGGGTHQWDVPWRDVQYYYRFTNYGDIMYSLCLLFTKLSIFLMIQRIFLSVKKDRFYWTIKFLIWVNCIFYTIFFFIPIFQCRPRTKIWNPQGLGKCLRINVLLLFSSAFNTISDITMLAVPIWMIWHLQMSLARKLGISMIFSCGGLAIIASILRLLFLALLVQTQDYAYVKHQSVMWATAEVAFGLMCSCFPILPRLYQHLASIAPLSTSLNPGMHDGDSTTKAGSNKYKKSPHWFDHEQSTQSDSSRGWFPMQDRESQDDGKEGGPQKVFAMLGRTKDEQRVDKAVEDDGTGLDLEKGMSVSNGPK